MIVLFLGSSLTKYAEEYDDEILHYIRAIKFKFEYKYYSGKSFEYMVRNPHLIDRALECNPDFIIVIFGANSISTKVQQKNVLDSCRDFYSILHEKSMNRNHNIKIIASECPMRYVYDNNHNTPVPQDFWKFRRYLNKKIGGLKSKHYTLRLSGDERLELKSCYSDGVHFSARGLKIFFEQTIKCLQYILDKENLSYQTQLSYPYHY